MRNERTTRTRVVRWAVVSASLVAAGVIALMTATSGSANDFQQPDPMTVNNSTTLTPEQQSQLNQLKDSTL